MLGVFYNGPAVARALGYPAEAHFAPTTINVGVDNLADEISGLIHLGRRACRCYLPHIKQLVGVEDECSSLANKHFGPAHFFFNKLDIGSGLRASIPKDFHFPLPESLNPSVGMLGPRNSYTVSAVAPKMYSDIEIAEMKAGTTRRLHVWGMVTYEDAFKIPRFLKFGHSIVWMADGTNTTSFNTERHNDAN